MARRDSATSRRNRLDWRAEIALRALVALLTEAEAQGLEDIFAPDIQAARHFLGGFLLPRDRRGRRLPPCDPRR